MAVRLTDKQRKKAIAEYISGDSMRSIAKRYSVAPSTIKRIIDSDPKTKQAATDKKEENTRDILAYLDSQTEGLKRFGNYLLDDRLDPNTNKETLDGTPLRDLINAYGVMVDKTLKSKEINLRKNAAMGESEDLAPLAELLKK